MLSITNCLVTAVMSAIDKTKDRYIKTELEKWHKHETQLHSAIHQYVDRKKDFLLCNV